MERKQMITRREFIPGKGHLVKEVSAGEPTETGRPVHAPARVAVAPAAMDREALAKQLELEGLMIVSIDDYNELQERNRELETLLDRAGEAVTEARADEKTAETAGQKKTQGKKGKAEKDERSIEEKIAAAESLDELTELMKDEKDLALLKLADARADELKEAGK